MKAQHGMAYCRFSPDSWRYRMADLVSVFASRHFSVVLMAVIMVLYPYVSLSAGRSLSLRYAVGLLSFSGFLLLCGCQKKTTSQAARQVVGVVSLQSQNVSMETSLPGRVEAYKQAQIRPQVNGVIVSRNFEQGADVKAGQQLYQIYIAPYEAAWQQAQGQLLAAQAAVIRANAQVRRYRPLVRTHAVSDQDYDNAVAVLRQARGQVEEAKAAVKVAEVNLGYTHVLSPIDGRIGRTLYTEGTLLTANQSQAIAVVTQLDPIYVDVNLAAEDMLRLQRELAEGRLERSANSNDAAVSVELPDGTMFEHKGRLALSEVTVDPSVGTIVLRAVMPNPDHLLLPGMYVHARIREGMEPATILLPQVAVQRTPKAEPYVMVVENSNNKVQARLIKLGRTIGNQWVVTSGLKMGERVVVSGLQRIHPGEIVELKDMTAEYQSSGQLSARPEAGGTE